MLGQAIDDVLRLLHDQAHCFFPGSFDKDTIFADEGVCKSVFMVNRLPLHSNQYTENSIILTLRLTLYNPLGPRRP